MLQIKHIRKQYVTGDLTQTALDDVSLNFRDNEFVAILGPSGSGKTTLLNIIGGLDRYDSGDLIINGISTKQYKDKDWDSYRNHTIGFVFQSYNLIPHQTVLSNVELALTISGVSKAERRKRAKSALEKVGLGNQLHKKPNQMSGGQMQRVAIARALVNNPAILLADEPTGALDSETSIQVMDMLKEVANDRLVIMVTHNPELAEEYANRIVRVKDGKILEDSNPLPSTAMQQETRHENMGKSSMSLFTALELSFNNLRTKKGRTLLTSFAGSIGIIGIALILSLSNGVNTYINDLQRDTMTAYPITIDANSIDLSSVMMNNMNTAKNKLEEEANHQLDAVYSDGSNLEMVSTIQTNIKKNNLTDFKNYLEDKTNPIHDFIGENGIVYRYNTPFSVFSYDENDELVNTDGSNFSSDSDNRNQMLNMMLTTNIMNTTPSNSNNFEVLLPGTNGELVSRAIQDNYDLLYGSYPKSYDEVVLVLDEQNELPLTVLYQLGFLPAKEYKNLMKEMKDGEKTQIDTEKLSYSEICNKIFYLVPACDMYTEQENGLFQKADFSLDEQEKNNILEHAIELKISGIIRLNQDCDTNLINSAVGYTNALTEYLIHYTEKSDVVKAQEKNSDINILTGIHFESKKEDEKIEDVKTYISDMGISEKAGMYQTILMLEQLSGKHHSSENPTESQTETETIIQNTPLAYSGRSDARTLNLGVHTGSVISLSEQFEAPEETTEAFTTEPVTENSGITIADFSLVKAPDKTIYTIGEKIDLTGGVVHDSVVISNQNGEPELIDSYQYMTNEAYILESEVYDNTRAGIYPVYLVKNYINTDGEPATEKIMFYVLVKEPQIIQDVTDATEPPVTETEPATTETSESETNISDTEITETSSVPSFTLPETLPTLPTMPHTGNNTNIFDNLTSDMIQQYLQNQTGQNTENQTGSNLTPDMIQQYLQNQNGMAVPSTGGMSQQDLASMYSSMMGSNSSGLSQQDLASMYSAMQGGSATATTPSGTLSQQDLASMYSAMQGSSTTTTLPSETISQQDFASIYSAMQNHNQTPDLSQEDMAAMYSQMYGNMSTEDIQNMLAVSNMSETELAQALDDYMKNPDEDILLKIYEQYISSGSYDTNMSTFGVVSLDAPASINIYVDSFESKESIADCITNYNKTVSEENQISYTDYIGLLMSSVTTIVNVISYVLIAFVAVSLIVSSIMIGIITYISVLERTKEIGILRAIGASKRNISQVFNAETFIIGLCSGLIGVGVTALLLIPANMVIHAIADTTAVSAILPVSAAIILIVISIILTLIGGFIPAKKASAKDAVIALRSE